MTGGRGRREGEKAPPQSAANAHTNLPQPTLGHALDDSPRMTTQRRQIQAAFGPVAQLQRPVQRKPVPQLTERGLKWYDDRDPLRRLYDSEVEVAMFSPYAALPGPEVEALDDQPVPLFDIRGSRLLADRRNKPEPEVLEVGLLDELRDFMAPFEGDPPNERAMVLAILRSTGNDMASTHAILDQLVQYQLYLATARNPRLLALVTGGQLEALGTLLVQRVDRDLALVERLLAAVGFGVLQSVAWFGREALLQMEALAPQRMVRLGANCLNRLMQIRWAHRLRQGLLLDDLEALVQEPDFAALADLIVHSSIPGGDISQRIAHFGYAAYVSLLRVAGITLPDVHGLTNFPPAAAAAMAMASVADLRRLCQYFVRPPEMGLVGAALAGGASLAAIAVQVPRLVSGTFYGQLLAHGLTVPQIGAMCGFGRAGLALLRVGLNAGQMVAVATACPNDVLQLRLADKLAGGLTAMTLHALCGVGGFAPVAWKLVAELEVSGAAIDAAVGTLGAADYVALLAVAGLAIGAVHQMADFGPAYTAPCAATLSADEMRRLLTMFSTRTRRQHIAVTLGIPAATLIGYLSGPLGAQARGYIMGKIAMATGADAPVATIAGIGQARYADLLPHCTPAQIRTLLGANMGHVTDDTIALVLHLLGQGISVANIGALHAAQPAVAGNLHGCNTVRMLQARATPWANLVAFINAHAALVVTQAGHDLVDHLMQRAGATSVNVSGLVLNHLPAGFSTAQHLALLQTHLPDLSLALLLRRLSEFGLPGQVAGPLLGAAVGVPMAPGAMNTQLTNDLQQLNQSMNQRHIPGNVQNAVRMAFQARNWRAHQLTAFFGRPAVSPLLQNGAATNPAFWLARFAFHNMAPSALAPPSGVVQTVPVAHALLGAVNVHITHWIINHVRNRHTWEHFDFQHAVLPDRDPSTNFALGTNVQPVIAGILGNPAVAAAVFDNRVIQVGSYSLRIQPDPVNAGYRLSAFFLGIAAGTPIPYAVLRGMTLNHLF